VGATVHRHTPPARAAERTELVWPEEGSEGNLELVDVKEPKERMDRLNSALL